ncbi:HD domain-containing protein [Alloiococcus sp. CFN-8]|uniref:HD domain-containing protein n=1 Tax=Alloiococcus sp. CFN-8 TaxID=3416081 RepID=UPI003CF4E981
MANVTFEDIKENKLINTLIERGDTVLKAIGYTEHSRAHAMKISTTAASILSTLGYSKEEIELARIAGYIHDIGNVVNRTDHAHSGAILAFDILKNLEMEPDDILTIVTAIGHHDENTGTAINPVSAAVILADKSDVRRNRVRNRDFSTFDIHDRVNYAVTSSQLDINNEGKEINLVLEIDNSISSIMDYFEIFLQRMIMCRRASELLGCRFRFTVNGVNIL